MSHRLENKVAIITGAGSGIGRETAIIFTTEGAKVVVADIDEQGGKETVEKIRQSWKGMFKNAESSNREAIAADGFFIKLDVTNREQTKQMVKDVLEKYGRIDILVNNAGIIQDALTSKMTEEQWDNVVNVNLKGAFNCIQAVVEPMINQGNGVIINTASIVGIFGNVGQVNYAATKAGLIGMTKTLAKELGKKGVRVNAVAPGFIITPMTATVPEKFLEIMKEKTPLRRLGQPKDVAYGYLYLASDEASFVNGAILCVDGGLII